MTLQAVSDGLQEFNVRVELRSGYVSEEILRKQCDDLVEAIIQASALTLGEARQALGNLAVKVARVQSSTQNE